MTTANTPQQDLQDQAAEWMLRLYVDPLDEHAREQVTLEFAEWLNAHPAHQQVWREAEQAWQQMSGLQSHPEMQQMIADARTSTRELSYSERLQTTPQGPQKKRWGYWLLWPALAASAAALLVVFLMPLSTDNLPQHYSTGIAELKTIELQDGSAVTLGARSEISVDFTDKSRRVILRSGDAFFDVGRDSQRPFLVGVGQATVRVLGTEFDIHLGPEEIRVGVLDGKVAVSAEGGAQEEQDDEVHLTIGQQVVLVGQQLRAVQELDVNAVGSWRQGRFNYYQASLAEVIADANRYSDKPISLTGPQLGDLRVATTYQTNQLASMLRSLEVALPVSVTETPMGILIKSAN